MEPGVTAAEYLTRDRLHHIDMLEALRRGKAEIRYAGPDGVLLYGPENDGWNISAATPEASRKLLSIPDALLFICAHQDFTVSQLREKYDSPFFLDCVQTAYFRSEPLPSAAVCEFRQMGREDAEWVNTHYHNLPGDLDYIRFLLEKNFITGAYVNGGCAGFVGRHIEGCIGLLEVLPEYRRLGIGSALARDAINRELANGNIPFGQVVCDNAPSLALQRSLGNEISEGHVHWMDLILRG